MFLNVTKVDITWVDVLSATVINVCEFLLTFSKLAEVWEYPWPISSTALTALCGKVKEFTSLEMM